MGTAELIRTVLIVDMVLLALLALVYLRQRRMNWTGYFYWGLLALLVPVLGPFLVIANRPGEWDETFSFAEDVKRLGRFLQRLLPGSPPQKKLTTLERARLRRKLRQRK